MKKLAFLIIAVALGVSAFGQRTIVDTLKGAENVQFSTMYGADEIQVKCTQLGGTSDGTLILRASTDGTTWTPISETNQLINYFPNDTLTITNGATWYIKVGDIKRSQIFGAGTTGDTTEITITWAK